MGVALWFVWNAPETHPQRKNGIIIFAVQLIFNFLWLKDDDLTWSGSRVVTQIVALRFLFSEKTVSTEPVHYE